MSLFSLTLNPEWEIYEVCYKTKARRSWIIYRVLSVENLIHWNQSPKSDHSQYTAIPTRICGMQRLRKRMRHVSPRVTRRASLPNRCWKNGLLYRYLYSVLKVDFFSRTFHISLKSLERHDICKIKFLQIDLQEHGEIWSVLFGFIWIDALGHAKQICHVFSCQRPSQILWSH